MKYFFGFLASIGLIVFVFILIIRGFSGGGSKKNVPAPLTDYTNTSVQMQYTIDGVINADQEHQALRITVDQNEAKIEVLRGYTPAIADTKTYPSNSDAYGAFLRALDVAGYTKGNSDSSKKDERGYCPNGFRYSFDIIDGSSTKQHYWTTSCGGGTSKGNSNVIRSLFQQQIPDYGTGDLTVK